MTFLGTKIIRCKRDAWHGMTEEALFHFFVPIMASVVARWLKEQMAARVVDEAEAVITYLSCLNSLSCSLLLSTYSNMHPPNPSSFSDSSIAKRKIYKRWLFSFTRIQSGGINRKVSCLHSFPLPISSPLFKTSVNLRPYWVSHTFSYIEEICLQQRH